MCHTRTSHRPKNPLLAAALARTGRTGQDVARDAKIHRVTFSRILNCHERPAAATAERIAAALDTTTEELFSASGGVTCS